MAPPASVWRTLRRLPAPVWFVYLGTFINKFGTFVVPFLSLHLTRLGFSARECGLALTAYGIGILGSSLLGGHFADSLGRKQTIILSMLGGATCMVVLSQAHTLPLFIFLAFATGLCGELHRPASSALLADLVPEQERVAAYAGYRFSINAGFAFGPAVAGLLAKHSYLWLFLGDAFTSALYAVIAMIWLPREVGRRAAGSLTFANSRRALVETARVAFAEERFVRLALASFGVGMVFFQLFSTFGLHLKALGFPEQTFGLILALNGLVVVLCEIPLSNVTQRLPARPVIALGFALIASGAGLFAWVTTPVGFAVGMIVFTVGETLSMPVSMAFVARLAPEAMRGRYMGLYGLTWALALAVGPGIGLCLFAWHPTVVWMVCFGLGLMASYLVLAGPRDGLAEAPRHALRGFLQRCLRLSD